MAGEKKIVGLWQSRTTEDVSAAAVAAPVAVEAESAPDAPDSATAERGWLDPLPAAADDVIADSADKDASGGSDRVYAALLILLGLGWTAFLGWTASDGGIRAPVTSELPMLVLSLAGPLTILLLLWIMRLLSGRVRTKQFARVAAALRAENVALQQSVAALAEQLESARTAMRDQGQNLQQHGLDAAKRMQDSSSKLSASVDRIVAANASLAQSGETAMQRMDGLLAGLPRVDDVAQRLTENFARAGLEAHQHGANLEAQLALLTERAVAADAAVQALMDQLGGGFRSMEGQVEKLCNTVSLRSDAAAAVQKRALGLIAKEQEAIEARVAEALASLQSVTTEARERLAAGTEESVAQLETRLAAATATSNALAAQLAEHAGAAEQLVRNLEDAVVNVDARLGALDAAVKARSEDIGTALAGLGSAVDSFGVRSEQGQSEVRRLLEGSESLLVALDAVTRELDEGLPAAFARVEEQAGTARNLVTGLTAPLASSAELTASVEAGLARTGEQAAKVQAMLDGVSAERGQLDDLHAALGEAEVQLKALALETGQFTRNGGAEVIATMTEVRDAAANAAGEARRLIETAVTEASGTLRERAAEALDAALKSEIDAQLSAIEAAADRAVTAANGAADKLMRQLITIMDTSAQVERRIAEAETAIAATDRDTLAKQVVVLTDSLKSSAIDITKILSTEISDAAWDAYLKGDRGVFSRRAIKLIDNSEAKEILRRYQDDATFQRHVNQYIHDFEAMLRALMGTRDGSAMSVILLSSDVGKLYVALAQAIDRLRT